MREKSGQYEGKIRLAHGEGMGSKGLDVCQSMEKDQECWRSCCLDGRHGLPWRSWQSYSQFARTAGTSSVFCEKTRLGSSNRTCRIFCYLGNYVEGTILFEGQCSLPCLTTRTAASAQCSPSKLVFAGPKFTKHHGTKSPLGRLDQSSFTTALVHFQNLQEMYKL